MYQKWKIAAGSIVLGLAIALSANTALAGPQDNSIVVALSTDLVQANPAIGTLGTDIPVLYVMYDRLVDFDPATLKPIPMLATDWSWSDDNKTLTLNLRQGVKFHDGTDFNADAVKKNLDFFKSSGRNQDLDGVTDVKVLGPYQVSITSKAVNSQLVGLLAERAGMMMSPAALDKYGDDYTNHPVGTGPYQFVSHVIDQSITFEKFPDYWDKEHAAKADKIEFRIIKDPTSAVGAMLSGQIDYLTGIDPVNLPPLQANPNVRVGIEPTIAYAVLKLDTSVAPIDKQEVRQAFSLAIDRDALGKAIYGSVPTRGTALPAPRQYWPSTDAVQDSVTYDPAKAKELLAAAGYPDGTTVNICVNSASGMPLPALKVMDIMAAQMKPAGFTLDVTQAASTAACSTLMNQKKATSILLNWSGRSDPASTYTQMMASANLLPNNPFNVAGRDYGADDLLNQLNGSFDATEQDKIYDQLNKVFAEQYPFMPLYAYVNVVVYKKGLVGEIPNLLGRPYVRTLYWQQ